MAVEASGGPPLSVTLIYADCIGPNEYDIPVLKATCHL